MFMVGVRKNICTTLFLEAEELHFQSTGKANVCIFIIISLRRLAVWASEDISKFFILIETFGNSIMF